MVSLVSPNFPLPGCLSPTPTTQTPPSGPPPTSRIRSQYEVLGVKDSNYSTGIPSSTYVHLRLNDPAVMWVNSPSPLCDSLPGLQVLDSGAVPMVQKCNPSPRCLPPSWHLSRRGIWGRRPGNSVWRSVCPQGFSLAHKSDISDPPLDTLDSFSMCTVGFVPLLVCTMIGYHFRACQCRTARAFLKCLICFYCEPPRLPPSAHCLVPSLPGRPTQGFTEWVRTLMPELCDDFMLWKTATLS